MYVDMYLYLSVACLSCAVGIYFGYWLRKRDEADGVVSALRTALEEERVPTAVRQQVLISSSSAQLLTLAHWKLKHSPLALQGCSQEDYKRCRSIASRIMLIKPLQ